MQPRPLFIVPRGIGTWTGIPARQCRYPEGKKKKKKKRRGCAGGLVRVSSVYKKMIRDAKKSLPTSGAPPPKSRSARNRLGGVHVERSPTHIDIQRDTRTRPERILTLREGAPAGAPLEPASGAPPARN